MCKICVPKICRWVICVLWYVYYVWAWASSFKELFPHTHIFQNTHTPSPTHTLPLPPLKNHVFEHTYSRIHNTSAHPHILHIVHIWPTYIFLEHIFCWRYFQHTCIFQILHVSPIHSFSRNIYIYMLKTLQHTHTYFICYTYHSPFFFFEQIYSVEDTSTRFFNTHKQSSTHIFSRSFPLPLSPEHLLPLFHV